MRKGFRVLLIVLGGIVGGYFGYWIGHLAGWSENADWPFRIGGGQGAILMSIGLAVVGVLVTGLWLALPSYLKGRRVLETGTRVPGTILEAWNLGFRSTVPGEEVVQYEFVIEFEPIHGMSRRDKVIQWVPAERAGELLPGNHVMVRYDPADPHQVAIEIPELIPVS
jgi:hypothetical protein